jgi:hypothetical protein
MSVALRPSLLDTDDEVCPGDRGFIDDRRVVFVSTMPTGTTFVHLSGNGPDFFEDQIVVVRIDAKRRELLSRWMLAARIVSLVSRQVFSQLETRSICAYPNRGAVEFGSDEYLLTEDEFVPQVAAAIEQVIRNDLPIIAAPFGNHGENRIEIGDLPPFICNRRYGRSVRSVGQIEILRVAPLNGRLQVRYRLKGGA